ncbi:MAG: SH3 domain-containing protein [Anaerolineae bacterium]|nr:SH3 domain-containing protein [Anaerolineae bacterium]
MPVIRRLLLLLGIVLTAAGFQSVEPLNEPINPNANVTWPPPVYVLRGETQVRGTANLPDMTGYFLEFRRLNDDLTPADDSLAWTPAILPTRGPVNDDVLGVWNTGMAPDGPYELRLTITGSSGQPVHARVSPLRIENTPPPFAITPTAMVIPTLVPQPNFPTTAPDQSLPTLVPTPTAFNLVPEAIAVISGNVRAGDSTSYDIIGSLVVNQRVSVVGRSSSGSGWWYIELPNGRRGWVAPSVVDVSGDMRDLPRINPPVTPTPIASPTPQLPDAVIANVRFDRDIKQDQSFQTIVTVRNDSGVFLPRFSVACNFTPVDKFYSTFVDGLGGFSQLDVALTVRLDEGGGKNVTANCAVDVNNLVAEVNENNNYFNLTAKLSNP